MREPPRFVTPDTMWAWTRVRDRITSSSGLDYDDWGRKQFMAASVIFKNTVNKYEHADPEERLAGPFECGECEKRALFYPDDFICKECRDRR